MNGVPNLGLKNLSHLVLRKISTLKTHFQDDSGGLSDFFWKWSTKKYMNIQKVEPDTLK